MQAQLAALSHGSVTLFSPAAHQLSAETPTTSAGTPIINDWHSNAIPQAIHASALSSSAGASRRSSGGASPRRKTDPPDPGSVVPVAVLGYGPGYQPTCIEVPRDRLIMSALQLMEPASSSAIPPSMRPAAAQLGLTQSLLNGNALASTSSKLDAECMGACAHTVGDAAHMQASVSLASCALPPAVTQGAPPPAGVRAPLALPGRYNPACIAGLMAGVGISGQLVFYSGWLEVACAASGAPVQLPSALPRGAAWLKRFAVITPHCLWLAKSPGEMTDIAKRTQVYLPLSPRVSVGCPPPSAAFPLRPRVYSSPRRNSVGASSTRLEALSAFGSALDVAAAISSRGRRFRGDLAAGFSAFVAQDPSAVLSFLDEWWQGADSGAVPPFAWPVASEMLAMQGCRGAVDAPSAAQLLGAVSAVKQAAAQAAPNAQLRSYQLQHLMNTAGLLLRKYCRGSAMQRAAACLLPECDPFTFSPAVAEDIQRSAHIKLQTPVGAGSKSAFVHLRLGTLADRALWTEALLLAAGQRASSGAAYAVPAGDLGKAHTRKSPGPSFRLWGASHGASPGDGVPFGGVTASASSTPCARHAPENTPHMPLAVGLISAARSRLLGDAASAVQGLVLAAGAAAEAGTTAKPPVIPAGRIRHKRTSTGAVLNDAATAMLRADQAGSGVRHTRSATIATPGKVSGVLRSVSSPDISTVLEGAADTQDASKGDDDGGDGLVVYPDHPLTEVLRDVLSGPLTVPLEWYHWSRDTNAPMAAVSTPLQSVDVAASALSAAYGSGSSGTVSLGLQDASLAQLIKDLGRDSLTVDGMYPLDVLRLSNPAVVQAAQQVRGRLGGTGEGGKERQSACSASLSPDMDALEILSGLTVGSPSEPASYDPAHKARLMLQAVATRVLAAAGEDGDVFDSTAAALAFARHVLLSCGRTVAGFDAFDVVQQLLVPAGLPDQVRDATVTAPWSGHDAPMDLHVINVQHEAVAVTRQLTWLRCCVVDTLCRKWQREWQELMSGMVPRVPTNQHNLLSPTAHAWAASILQAADQPSPVSPGEFSMRLPPPKLHLPRRANAASSPLQHETKAASSHTSLRQRLRQRLQDAVVSAAAAVQASPRDSQLPGDSSARFSTGRGTPQAAAAEPSAYKMQRRSLQQRPPHQAVAPSPAKLSANVALPDSVDSCSDSEDSLQGLSDLGSMDGLDDAPSSGEDSSDLEADSDFDEEGGAGGVPLSPEEKLHKRWQDELAVGTSLPFLLALLHPQALRRLSVAGDLVRHRIGCDEVYVAVESAEDATDADAASPMHTIGSALNSVEHSPHFGTFSPDSSAPASRPGHRKHSLSAVPSLGELGMSVVSTAVHEVQKHSSLDDLVGLRSASLPGSDSDDELVTRHNPLQNTTFSSGRHRRSATVAAQKRPQGSVRRARTGTGHESGLTLGYASRHQLQRGTSGGKLGASKASSVRSGSQRTVAPRPWWWLGREMSPLHVHDLMQGGQAPTESPTHCPASSSSAPAAVSDATHVSTSHIPNALLVHFSCVNAYRLMNAEADFGDGRDSTVARLAVRYIRTFVVDGRHKPLTDAGPSELHAHVPSARMLRAAGSSVSGCTASKPHVSVVGVPGGRSKGHEAADLEELQTAARGAWGAWVHLSSAGELGSPRV